MKNVAANKWTAAWLCAFVNFLLTGSVRLSGMLFPSVMSTYNASRSQASLAFFLCNAVGNTTGPLTGYLGDRFGLRRVTVIGCLLSSIGMGACFLVESVIPFTILWGGVFGMGFGLGTLLIPQILNQYFEKKTSLANGIALSGSCLGGIALPPLTHFLLKSYGLQGTMLILSALMLHSVPFVMLLRKSKSSISDSPHGRKRAIIANEEKACATTELRSNVWTQTERGGRSDHLLTHKEEKCAANPSFEKSEKSHESFHPPTSFTKNLRSEPASNKNDNVEKLNHSKLKCKQMMVEAIENKCRSQLFDHTQSAIDRNTAIVNSSNYDNHTTQHNAQMFGMNDKHFNSCEDLNKLEVQREYKHNISDISKDRRAFKQTTNVFEKFQVFIDPAFLLILVVQSFVAYTFVFLITIINDYAKDDDVTDDQAAYPLMALAAGDVIGRFFPGFVTDCGLLSSTNFYVFCSTGMGIAFLLLNWFGGFQILMVSVSLFGLTYGGTVCVAPTVCLEFIEPEKLGVALASRFFLLAPLCLTMSPLIGLFRTQGGSYKPIIILLTVLSFACALMSFAIPSAARRRDKRRRKFIS